MRIIFLQDEDMLGASSADRFYLASLVVPFADRKYQSASFLHFGTKKEVRDSIERWVASLEVNVRCVWARPLTDHEEMLLHRLMRENSSLYPAAVCLVARRTSRGGKEQLTAYPVFMGCKAAFAETNAHPEVIPKIARQRYPVADGWRIGATSIEILSQEYRSQGDPIAG